jgi:hypothetical protein
MSAAAASLFSEKYRVYLLPGIDDEDDHLLHSYRQYEIALLPLLLYSLFATD